MSFLYITSVVTWRVSWNQARVGSTLRSACVSNLLVLVVEPFSFDSHPGNAEAHLETQWKHLARTPWEMSTETPNEAQAGLGRRHRRVGSSRRSLVLLVSHFFGRNSHCSHYPIPRLQGLCARGWNPYFLNMHLILCNSGNCVNNDIVN